MKPLLLSALKNGVQASPVVIYFPPVPEFELVYMFHLESAITSYDNLQQPHFSPGTEDENMKN